MGLTHYALEQMGFRRKRDDEALSATFCCVYAFEVQGVSPSQGLLIDATGIIAGVDYRLALSETLNAAALRIADDDYADGEASCRARQSNEGAA